MADVPAIQHDPIACVVAGEFPRLDACFTPVENVTRPRAYFKSDTGAAWYWVEFTRDLASTPGQAVKVNCFNAVLPKPTKKIAGLVYYVEVANPQYEVGRLDDNHVRVVPEKGGCRKDEPVAATVSNAVVAVGAAAGAPAVPVGFAAAGIAGAAGGIGAGAVALAAVGGAGAVAGGVAVANGGRSNPTPTVVLPTATPVVVATSTPTPTPTVTPTQVPNFKAVINVYPLKGNDPLLVTFDTCASTGQNLRYDFDFDGDGIRDLGSGVYCNVTRMYHGDGTITTFAGGKTVRSSAAGPVGCAWLYNPSVTVREGIGDRGGSLTQVFQIQVDIQNCGLRSASTGADSAPKVTGTTNLVGSELAQIVLNGDTPLTAARGRSSFTAAGRAGTNRIELHLTQGAGAGSVTFDLAETTKFMNGSLKVVAGDAISVSGSSAVFRLRGAAGETVAFTFDVAQ
jgi:hypothetical protein